MDWNEEAIVTLTDCTEGLAAAKISLFTLDVLQHRLERIRFLLDLSTADLWQKEVGKLVDVRLGGVDFATSFACEVLLSLSVFYCCCSHHSAIDDHVLVHMALPHVSN